MTCHNCRTEMVKAGFYGRNKVQRYKCQKCGKRLSEEQQKPFGADVRIPREKIVMILHCLVEGNSVRSTSRLCDVEKRTVLNVLTIAGEACERLLNERIQRVTVRNLEFDEGWTYVKKREGHKWPEEENNTKIGDAYTFIALDRESKLVLAWHLGKRDRENTEAFTEKVRLATAPGEYDISTDAFIPYGAAIDLVLGDRANHSQVVKVYDKLEEGRERYSPGQFVTVDKKAISGHPDLQSASTAHVERNNGSLRQWCKRLTRLDLRFLEEMGEPSSGPCFAF